jgi:hypothetical protein
MPAARINPVVNGARGYLRAEIEGSAHGALDAAIPEGRFGGAALQITGHGRYFSLKAIKNPFPITDAVRCRLGVNSRLRRFASATPYDRNPLKADMILTAPAAATHARLPQ